MTVTFTVKNTGSRAGAETAEVYAELPSGTWRAATTAGRLAKSLAAAGAVAAGQRVGAAKLLSTWDATNHEWKLNAGAYGWSQARRRVTRTR